MVEAARQRARLAEDRLAEVLDAYRNLKNENEGYRDRVARNLTLRYDQRRERLLLKFIEILDNLDRALEAAERTYAGNPLIEGLILVRTQLLQTLKDEGLERIPVVGLPYDPEGGEAVETQEVDDPEQHHVVLRDLQRGYRLAGRVVRAARVVVGEYRGPQPLAEAAPRGPDKDPEEITLSSLTSPDAAAHKESPAASEVDRETSLEDIVAQAEATSALFPAVFEGPKSATGGEGEPEDSSEGEDEDELEEVNEDEDELEGELEEAEEEEPDD